MSRAGLAVNQGSSPRMRGTPGRARTAQLDDGIIPAYAGNTPARHQSKGGKRDHPRVCGEHLSAAFLAAVKRGSSPRMRGTLDQCTPQRQNHGIIPAYAGNTGASSVSDSSRKDHPRVCGEHTALMMTTTGRAGSSPRMRGTPVLHESRTLRGGIIPAYAGNTECP